MRCNPLRGAQLALSSVVSPARAACVDAPFVAPRAFLGNRDLGLGLGIPLTVPTYTEPTRTSSLLACVERGSLSGCAALLRAGADPLRPVGDDAPRTTPLAAAAARLLTLSARADAEFTNDEGPWPAHDALAPAFSVFATLSRTTDRSRGEGASLAALPQPASSLVAQLVAGAAAYAEGGALLRAAVMYEAGARSAAPPARAPRGTAVAYESAGPSLWAAVDAADVLRAVGDLRSPCTPLRAPASPSPSPRWCRRSCLLRRRRRRRSRRFSGRGRARSAFCRRESLLPQPPRRRPRARRRRCCGAATGRPPRLTWRPRPPPASFGWWSLRACACGHARAAPDRRNGRGSARRGRPACQTNAGERGGIPTVRHDTTHIHTNIEHARGSDSHRSDCRSSTRCGAHRCIHNVNAGFMRGRATFTTQTRAVRVLSATLFVRVCSP